MKKNILIVEYDTPTIEDLEIIFANSIFQLDIAEDGIKAKELLKKTTYDLVVTAAMLPKFHGFNLAQLISKDYPDTKILIISGVYKGIEYKRQAINQYGATDFFEKPLQKEEFKNQCFSLLNLDLDEVKEEKDPTKTAIPDISTKKIKKPEFDEKVEGLSSEDMFGDIIQEVESIDFQLDKIDLITEEIPVKKVKKDPAKAIEDEIARKFEETLSGLGLLNKMGKISTKKEPVKTQQEEQDITQKEDEGKKAEEKKQEEERLKAEAKTKKLEEERLEEEAKKKEKEQVKEEAKKTKEIKVESQKEAYGYDILGLIARGGMAEIYKARKHGVKGFEKIIALKKILTGYGEDDKFIEMFVDEAKIAAELTHPNIVQIFDLGKEEENYFIAMEYVEGTDLRMLFRKLKGMDRPLPEELSLHIVIKILNALEYAHSAKNNRGISLNIVHRDISPPNILLSYSGEVKLTDFGVSKASIKMHQTVSGSLKGKLLYMSPEQSKGDQSVDSRADIFAAGIILYELITGIKPFLASSEMGVLNKLQNVNCPKPSEIFKDIDPQLETIILKALQKNKEERYQTAEDMSKDLELYIEDRFNNPPNFTYLAYFISEVFEKEIKEKGIKLKQKFKPKPIFKKVRPEPIKEKKIEVLPKEEPKKEKELLLLHEEFEPAVEIDLENKKNEVVKEVKIDAGIYDELALEEKKGKKGFLITIIVIVLLAGGYFLVNNFILNKKEGDEVAKKSTIQKPQAGETNILKDDPKDLMNTQLNQDIQQLIESEKSTLEGERDQAKTETSPVETSTKEEITKQASLKIMGSNKTGQNRVRKETTKKPQDQTESQRPKPQEKQEIPEPTKTQDEEEILKEESKETDDTLKENDKIEEIKKITAETPKVIPPKPEVKEGMIFKLSEVNMRPTLVEKVLPEIKPKHKRALKYIREAVEVRFLVNHYGKVEIVQLVKGSSSFEINLIITSAIKRWQYQPGIKDNIKVKVWLVEVFNLNKN